MRADRARGIVARWRRAGYAATGRLGTDTTPATLAALLADPRTDDNQAGPQPAEPAPPGVLEQGPIRVRGTGIMERGPALASLRRQDAGCTRRPPG